MLPPEYVKVTLAPRFIITVSNSAVPDEMAVRGVETLLAPSRPPASRNVSNLRTPSEYVNKPVVAVNDAPSSLTTSG